MDQNQIRAELKSNREGQEGLRSEVANVSTVLERLLTEIRELRTGQQNQAGVAARAQDPAISGQDPVIAGPDQTIHPQEVPRYQIPPLRNVDHHGSADNQLPFRCCESCCEIA